MRHLFIINPVAGDRDKGPVRARIEDLMTSRGGSFEIYETTGVMDAAEKVKREAIKGDELRVYACGGDGTLSECAHGAAGYANVAVTHYPCGTGNDFVRMFGPDAPLFNDLERLVEGDASPIDIIDVNGRRCVNIASVGIDARVGIDVHKYSKLPLIGGAGGYVISLVVNVIKGINRPFTVTTDEGVRKGKFALVSACNGQYYGGGFNPTRTATPEDGVLDILIVRDVSRLTLARLLKYYASGQYEKYPEYIHYVAGRHITIESEREFSVSIDGEAMYTKCAKISLKPGGVNFIYPKGCRKVKDLVKIAQNV